MYIQQNGWWLIFLHQITQQFRAPSQATNTRKGHLTLHHLLHLSSHQISLFFLPVLTFFGLGNSMKPYETIISVNKPNLCLICWNIICWWFRHDIVTTIVTKGCLDLRDPWRLVELASGIAPLGACENLRNLRSSNSWGFRGGYTTGIYPLVNIQKAMENHPAINGKTH